MDTIRDYVETMFINLPETPEILRLKEDILANMEDKYHELKDSGKNENEAIGIVISEFGNIDEVLQEMGIEETETEELLPVVDMDTALEYINVKRKVGFGIGVGVFFCALGVASLLFSLGFFESNGPYSLIGLIPLVLFAALGVGSFILNGFRIAPFEYLEKEFVLIGGVRLEVEEMKKNYQRSHVLSIIIGVGLCIVSLLPLFISMIIWPADSENQLIAVGLMLIIASIGTLFFIYSGNIISSFERLLTNGRAAQPTKEERKKSKAGYIIDAAFWPIIVVIYFYWSFVYSAWPYSWVIWVLAGALESTIKAMFGIYEDD